MLGPYKHMCFYLKLFAATIEVMNETAAENNATIQLRSGNFTSNLTITYEPCSRDPSNKQFRPPVVHLENLTADIMYCYSITYNGNGATQVAGSCNGKFHTTADTTTHTPQTTGTITFLGQHEPRVAYFINNRDNPQLNFSMLICTHFYYW